MSDFVTRLVERQTGALAMVQPRTPSMFAPTGSRTEPSDFPVLDSSLPQAGASEAPAASIRQGDHEGELLTRTRQRERRAPASVSRPTPRATPGSRQAESSPARLGGNAPAVVPQPTHETLAPPQVSSVTIHTLAPGRQMGTTHQNIAGHLGSAPPLPTARIESPPRLVETRQAMPRSSVAAPPSLASELGTGRKTQHINAASTEPPVEVTIGRIEVTAVSGAPDQKRKPGSRRPAMSLEDYLTRRQGGRP